MSLPRLPSSRRPDRLPPGRRSGLSRLASWWAPGLLPLLLTGCPLFPENGCFTDRDCADGYACEARTGACVPEVRPARVCGTPTDCDENETCGRNGLCSPGDCTFSGCVGGYRCAQDEGYWACVPDDDGPNDPGEGGSAGEGGESGSSMGGSNN